MITYKTKMDLLRMESFNQSKDAAPWELGVDEKSKPKLNTVGTQCQRKDIAQWLQTFGSLLQSLQGNLCVSQVLGCAVVFQIWAIFGLCGTASIFTLPFSTAFSLTIARVWPLMASFVLCGDVWLITSLGIQSAISATTHTQLWFEQRWGIMKATQCCMSSLDCWAFSPYRLTPPFHGCT